MSTTDVRQALAEREAFEAWCVKRWCGDRGGDNFLRFETDGPYADQYRKGNVEFAWCAWKAARAALAEQPASVAVARPLEWERDSYGLWIDANHGFSILLEEGDDEPYSASWGEDDAEQFATLEKAQAWCQQQIDDWVARHVVLASSPQPPTQQEGS